MTRSTLSIALLLLASLMIAPFAPGRAAADAARDSVPVPARIASAEDVTGTADLKAVPRPPDGVILEWKAAPNSVTIVYRYPSSAHSAEEIVQFYVDTLPGLGWVWQSRGGKTLEQSIAENKLSYNYVGSEPLKNLQLDVRKDATVRVYVTHAKQEAGDFSLFVGYPLELGEDMEGAYDLKAVPRPPDSAIGEWKATKASAKISYRYDWEKHSMDDIVAFYVQTLPDLGWVWVSRGGQTLEQNISQRKLNYEYAGAHPLKSLQLQVTDDRTVDLYVTFPSRDFEDLSLFAGHPLVLGNDLPGTYDLKGVPRPPDSVISDWKATPTSLTVDYRYNWERYSPSDIISFYVEALPDFGWVWESRGGKTLEQNMAARELSYEYEGQMTLKGLTVDVRDDRTVRLHVTYGRREDDDLDLFSVNGPVVVDYHPETTVDIDQTIAVDVNVDQDQQVMQDVVVQGGTGFFMVTPPPTPVAGLPFQHVKISDQLCSTDELYFTLSLEKQPDYPMMDYVGVRFSVLDPDSRFLQVVPVLDEAKPDQMIVEPLQVDVYGTGDQPLLQMESLTGTVTTTAAGIYEALVQPVAQSPESYQIGWDMPRLPGERMDFLVHVGGKAGVPFGAVVNALADPSGFLPADSRESLVVCQP